MTHPYFSLIAAVLLLLLLRLPSALSQSTCATQILPSNRHYANCTNLPKLSATLHYTYDPANSSLSIAYIAAPSQGGAWIGWAINPTATGMVGAQAILALKPSGSSSVVAKTFNISSYSSIVESPLSFQVWGLQADEVGGMMRLFASVKVPTGATDLNQVWQIGGAVNGTRPTIHPLNPDNKESKDKLVLVSTAAEAPSPGGSTGGDGAAPPPKSGGPRVNGRLGWSWRVTYVVLGVSAFGLAF